MKKILAVGIILLFLGSSIPAIAQTKEHSRPLSHTLYVGGSGPWNYTKIQDALNASTDGDTIFVYTGTYQENLAILHSVRLIGESKNTTIIESKGSDNWDMIMVQKNNVTISGFTLRADNEGHALSNIIYTQYWGPGEQNNLTILDNVFSGENITAISGYNLHNCTIIHNTFHLPNAIGISLEIGQKCIIADNIFLNPIIGISSDLFLNMSITNNTIIGGCFGIEFLGGSSCSIMNNIIKNMIFDGMQIEYSYNVLISKNTLMDNQAALFLPSCSNLNISYNIINNTKTFFTASFSMGIHLNGDNNTVCDNLIRHCQFGLYMTGCSNTHVLRNTFENNVVHARFNVDYGCQWNQNYWGRPRLAPKPIFGIRNPLSPYPGFFEFDWHPAQQPYNNSTGGFQ